MLGALVQHQHYLVDVLGIMTRVEPMHQPSVYVTVFSGGIHFSERRWTLKTFHDSWKELR